MHANQRYGFFGKSFFFIVHSATFAAKGCIVRLSCVFLIAADVDSCLLYTVYEEWASEEVRLLDPIDADSSGITQSNLSDFVRMPLDPQRAL